MKSKFDKTGSSLEVRTSNFLRRAIERHNSKYSYNKLQYKNANSKVLITCPIHGDFQQTANDHVKGAGCPACGRLSTTNSHTLSFSEFKNRAIAVHGTKYAYNESLFTMSSEKVGIVCTTCMSEFTQLGSMHLQGQGCSKCNKHGLNYTQPTILYFLSVNKGVAFKIGITNFSVNERFLVKDLKTIEVVAAKQYNTGYEAYDAEQAILLEFKDKQYRGAPLLSTGNTELFSENIFNEIKERYFDEKKSTTEP